MTIACERDYLSATDPAALLSWATYETLQHPPGWQAMSERQLRLFAEACAHMAGRETDIVLAVSRSYQNNQERSLRWAGRWASVGQPGTPSTKVPQPVKADMSDDTTPLTAEEEAAIILQC